MKDKRAETKDIRKPFSVLASKRIFICSFFMFSISDFLFKSRVSLAYTIDVIVTVLYCLAIHLLFKDSDTLETNAEIIVL